jgi:hypothetical protein
MDDFLTEPGLSFGKGPQSDEPLGFGPEDNKPLFEPFIDPDKPDSDFKAAGTPFLTEEALRKATEGVFNSAYNKGSKKTYMHPDDYRAATQEIFTPKPVSSVDFLNTARLSKYLTINTVEHGCNALLVPFLAKPTPTYEDAVLNEVFTEISVKVKDVKIHGLTSNAADVAIYKILRDSNTYTPHIMSPDTTVTERMVEAVNLMKLRGLDHDKSILVMDGEALSDFHLTLGMNDEPKSFMGIPIMAVPQSSNGDIFLVNPKTAFIYAVDTAASTSTFGSDTIRAGGGFFPDAVMVSCDPSAHTISKHFDEDTNDWCVDCWTCGYSSWAGTEEEADEKLNTHAGKDIRLFYKR